MKVRFRELIQRLKGVLDLLYIHLIYSTLSLISTTLPDPRLFYYTPTHTPTPTHTSIHTITNSPTHTPPYQTPRYATIMYSAALCCTLLHCKTHRVIKIYLNQNDAIMIFDWWFNS